MCGINGSLANSPKAPPVDEQQIRRISQSMNLRGPDDSGVWVAKSGRVGFCHRRLSIIDLSAGGHQPMHSPDGRLTITYNGEIFNYKALKERLELQGEVFRSHSDTEVLLALYQKHGPDMLSMLRGMFALAIWDEQRQSLFLARDPLGIKPLYLAETDDTLHFASQVKALVPYLQDSSPDPAGHVGFLVMGHIPEPFTLYRGIKALRAGHYAIYSQEVHGQQIEYASVRGALLGPQSSINLHDALLDSVVHHYVSDVPVSLFLSAGRDSGTLLALSAEIPNNRVSAVTLAFDEYAGTENDETALAQELAQAYCAQHQITRITGANFKEDLDRVFEAMDQPSIDGLNTYYVSKVAAELGLKVVLSGLGGDELFGGYPSFQQVPKLAKTMGPMRKMPGLGRSLRKCMAAMMPKNVSPKYAGIFEYGGAIEGAYLLRRGVFMPWDLESILDPDFAREGWDSLGLLSRMRSTIEGLETPYSQVAALEMEFYMRDRLLRDSDWASMSHSLELRVPLVDYELLKNLGPQMSSSRPPTKADMANTPIKSLPSAVLNRPKTGFTIPVREWASGLEVADGGEASFRRWALMVYRRFCPDGCLAKGV